MLQRYDILVTYANILKKKRKKLTYFFDTTYCTKYQKIVILQSKNVQFHSRKWYYGTVMANPGVQGNSVYPSFFANLTEDGGLLVPLWFFVSGSVTIENKDGKLYLEVNGLNSYNQTIHITYDASKTSGVENVTTETSAKKVVKNGQLLIMRDGETFNVLGAQVK